MKIFLAEERKRQRGKEGVAYSREVLAPERIKLPVSGTVARGSGNTLKFQRYYYVTALFRYLEPRRTRTSALLFGGLVISRVRQKLALVTGVH